MQKKESKEKTKAQKIIIKAIIILSALMVILIILNSIDFENIDISSLLGKKEEDETENFSFYTADYDYDIFSDEEYSQKEVFITYTEYPFTTIISRNINEYGSFGTFLLDYFDSIIYGNSSAYNNFFTDSYINENGKKNDYTMQMLYDIEVELEDLEIIEDGEKAGLTVYTLQVQYKIMKNNGTFRSDMGSDDARPIEIEIYFDGNEFRINNVSKIKYNK